MGIPPSQRSLKVQVQGVMGVQKSEEILRPWRSLWPCLPPSPKMMAGPSLPTLPRNVSRNILVTSRLGPCGSDNQAVRKKGRFSTGYNDNLPPVMSRLSTLASRGFSTGWWRGAILKKVRLELAGFP